MVQFGKKDTIIINIIWVHTLNIIVTVHVITGDPKSMIFGENRKVIKPGVSSLFFGAKEKCLKR